LVSYFGVFPDRYIGSTVLTTCDNKLGGEETRAIFYSAAADGRITLILSHLWDYATVKFRMTSANICKPN